MDGRSRRLNVMVWVVAAMLLAGPMLLAPPTANAEEGSFYFWETGYWVDPLFYDYFQSNGGIMTFGYPISRVFYQDGLHRQYFERAIFEHHENETGDWRVMLVRLGALNTTERRQDPTDTPFVYRAKDPDLDAGGIYFPETGHTLSVTFRDYWERHGGIQSFGYPLSDEFMEPSIEDGVLRPVQYFERARFEWHAEYAGSGFEVLLGHLGREAMAKRAVPSLAVTPQAQTEVERNAQPLGPLPTGQPTAVDCGFNLAFYSHDDTDSFNEFYVNAAAESGCEWIRFQFTWRDLQPREGQPVSWTYWPYKHVVELAKDRGLKVLVNIAHPPAWAWPGDKRIPARPAAFEDFATELVTLMGGQVDAWQIWNEPNLIAESNGIVDPAGFLPILRAGYKAVKAADPDALVVFPGLAPNTMMRPQLAMADGWYLETLLGINNGEAAGYFDVLAIHAYGAGNDPDTYWPGNLAENPGWTEAPEFYFRHAEQLRNVMIAAGLADRPIWITEMGWPVGNYQEVWAYGEWVTSTMQADYTSRAFEIMRTEWHWVETAFVWHLNFAEAGGPDNHWTGFSLFSYQREPTHAYDTISRLSKTWQSVSR